MSNPWAIRGMILAGRCQSARQQGYLTQAMKEQGVYGASKSQPSRRLIESQLPQKFPPLSSIESKSLKPVPRKPVTETSAYKDLEARLQKLTSKGAKRVIESQMRAMRKKEERRK